jgi:alpha-tubulin suppressor-like RCC1 family protein
MGTTPVCVNGACVTCAPASLQCIGPQPQSCSSKGEWENVGLSCAAFGDLCAGGSCASPIVSTGLDHACALLLNGTVECWGGNQYGQLGDGTTTSSLTPVVVPGLPGVATVSAGDYSTCAVLSGGTTGSTVECWGDGSYGELGDGTTTSSSTPVVVSGLSGVTAVSVGGGFACAVLSNGTVACWGNNRFGQLGDGTATSSATPVVVTGLSGVTAVSVSGSPNAGSSACAVLSNGTVECWGIRRDGTTTTSATPVVVRGLSGVTAVSVGSYSVCALLLNGTVECWGDNHYGLLGDPTLATLSSRTPVVVSRLSGVTDVSVGVYSACALRSDGTVACWGDDQYGQLGNPSVTRALGTSYVPVVGVGDILLTGVRAVSAGGYSACALLPGAAGIDCWGYNASGQLGNGTTTNSDRAVGVLDL